MPWVIKTVLGVVVVLLGLEMATRSLRPVKPDRKDRPWLRLAVSAFSGVCAGLFGINMAFAAVNLNTATASDLDGIKGIGPSKAKAIIDYRSKNGSFKSVEDLKNVKGFGEKSIAKLKGELTVSGGESAKK